MRNIKNEADMIRFMQFNRFNVFKFDLNSSYRTYLDYFAQSAEAKFYINFSYINNANIDQVKKRLNGEIEIETN